VSRWRASPFGLRIALALVVTAVAPLLVALPLAGWLAENNAGVWLAPRVAERLETVPGTYLELFRARKQLYAEQARALARSLPSDGARALGELQAAVERLPFLRRATLVGPDGAIRAEASAPDLPDEEPWRAAPVEVSLPGGGALKCTFAVEASLFAELDETRALAEMARDMGKAQAQVRRTILWVFGGTVAGAALLAALLGVVLARRTTSRLARLVEAHRRVAGGDLTARVEPGRSRDEVAELAHAFNAMVGEVREARDRIVYLEKISGWQEVARRLAHEIKNPLTPIQLAFQQLEARWRAAPGDQAFGRLLDESAGIVRAEVGTLQRLVHEFSEFARLPDVKAEAADLGAFAEEFVRTSPQLAEVAELEVVRASGDVPVSLDPALMRRVLVNLVDNAVEAARPERARVHLGVARTRDRGVLTVSDDGPGIDPAIRHRLFDPYVTTKVTGTGLGLATVKKIVLQHGGTVEVGERPGGGASFALAFPLAHPAAGLHGPAPAR
jgi:nitrogen fixation/metabolism regulation signal transduction histidine kinase